MATVSTVPAVKDALVTLLTSAINDNTVQVVYGPTPDSLKKRKVVVVGEVSSYQSNIANIVAGRKQRDERYTIDVYLFCAKPRGQAVDADTTVWELFESLENVLADDPSLGAVNGLVWAVLGGVQANVTQEKEGPVAWISAGVDCYGRLV